MTTDERIRRAYRSLSEQASLHIDPASGLVAVRGHRRRRSRPVLALTAIAAAVLVVAAGLTALSLVSGGDSDVATRPDEAVTSTLSDPEGDGAIPTGGGLAFDPRSAGEVFAVTTLDDGVGAGPASSLDWPIVLPPGTVAAVPDGGGGVVYTLAGGLWWLPEPSAAPVVLEQHPGTIELIGLRHLGGEPVVLARIGDLLVGYDRGTRVITENLVGFSGQIRQLAVDGDRIVAIVATGDRQLAVERSSLPGGGPVELAPAVDADDPAAPLAIAVSGGQVAIVHRAGPTTVVTADGSDVTSFELPLPPSDLVSLDLVEDELLATFAETWFVVDTASGEHQTGQQLDGRTLPGLLLQATWAGAVRPAGSEPAGDTRRFRVNAELVAADIDDPHLNVRQRPGTGGDVVAQLPPNYAGLAWSGTSETTDDGAVWYEVELLDPVRLSPQGSRALGWVNSAFLVPLPQGLAVTTGEVPACTEPTAPVDQGRGTRSPDHVYALASSYLSPRCLRVVLTFGGGQLSGGSTAEWSSLAADVGPAGGLPDVRVAQSGGSVAKIDLAGVDSAWPGATETADGAYLVRQPDGSLQLWVAISGQPMIHGVSERGVVVVDLWLDRAGGDPPAAPGIVVTGPVSAGPGTITVAGIARPFEADLGVSIEDASGRPVEAVYSGSTDRGTIGASGYGVETSDWTEAWAPFAVGAEGLAPGDYTMVLDARGGGESPGGPRALHLPFSITERGREPALATAAELDVVRALVDWAGAGRDAGGASDAVAPPLATEVTLHLGLQQTTAATRAELDDPATWVFGAETFNGRRGDFSPLAYLAGAGPLRVTSGPIPHCAGPPLDWPAELDGLRQVNVEPVGASSCVSWFAVSLFLDPSGRISAVALDLWEP